MKTNTQGFTLLELIIVILIFGILLAIAIPSFSSILDKARLNTAIFQLSQFWKETRYNAAGGGASPDSLCMKADDPIQYAQISGRDCLSVSSWQTFPAGVQIALENSTLYSVNENGTTIYRVSWADTRGGYGGSAGRLGRITLTNRSNHQKCIFLYSVDGSWNIREENQCER